LYIANVSTYAGDMWEDEHLYFGTNKAARPLLGIDAPAMQHETTPESLARITKLNQMKNPWYSWPIYLGNVSMTSPIIISGNRYRDLALFDAEGVRVCWNGGLGVPEETGANGQNVSSHHTPFYGYYIIEKNLRILLANGGRFDQEKADFTFPAVPPRALIPGRAFRPDRKGWHGFCLNVKSVDLETSEIVVESGQFFRNHQLEKVKDKFKMTLVVDENTRIVIKEKEKNFNGRHNPVWLDSYRHGTLKDIVKGDLLRVDILLDPEPKFEDEKARNVEEHYTTCLGKSSKCARAKYKKAFKVFSPIHCKDKKVKALRIWNNHTGGGDTKVHQQIVFWGEIKKMNPDKKTIEVHMTKPDGNEIHGYRFWKEAGDKADIAEDTRGRVYRTAEKLAASTRYVEGSDEDRIRVFHIDGGVRISRNGVPEKAFEDFKVGDKISVFYLPFYESQYNNTIPIYPEVILSSSDIKVK